MRLALLVTIIAALLVPATASAGIVTTKPDSAGGVDVVYTGSTGEANTVNAHFALFGHWIDIYDQSAPMWTSDPNCSVVHAWQIHCNMPADLSSTDSLTNGVKLIVYLGGGDGSFYPSPGTQPFQAIVYGGPGVNEITLPRNQSPWPSEAFGGNNQTIFHSDAQPGDTPNMFFGGAGDDIFNTINGAPDSISCGAGNDRVYADPGDQVATDCENVRRS